MGPSQLTAQIHGQHQMQTVHSNPQHGHPPPVAKIMEMSEEQKKLRAKYFGKMQEKPNDHDHTKIVVTDAASFGEEVRNRTGFGSDRDGIIRDRHYNHPSHISPQNIAHGFGHVPHDLQMPIEALHLPPTYNEMNEALPIYTVLNSGDVSNIGSNRGAGGGAQFPSNYRANEALSLSAFPVLNSSDVKAHGAGRLGQDDNRDSNKGKQRKLAEKHNAKQTVQFKKKKENKPSKSPEH